MKIRTDYVTNSSSSSFILGFTNEDNIKYELVDGFNSWEMEYFGKVFNDVQEAQRLTKEEVFDRFYDELEWEAGYAVARKKGIDPWRNWNWRENDGIMDVDIGDKYIFIEQLKSTVGIILSMKYY